MPYFYQAWEEWIGVIIGAWLVICPWVLNIVYRQPGTILSLLGCR